ncbi:hypothetical protein QN380_23375, partial [Pseudomonas sp. MH10]|nr:hypothetical protein [Pseudomonas sp. MH10]
HLGLAFFPGDHQDEKLQNCKTAKLQNCKTAKLQNCFDGMDLENNKRISCSLKDASSIKAYLKLQDARQLEVNKKR